MKTSSGVLVALVAFALPFAAFGTVVIAQSFEQMAKSSPQVVRGTVGAQEARWDEGRRTIHTFTQVHVTERLKGDPAGIITVRQPGGVVGTLGQTVSGAARFTEGEEVLLFLEVPGDDASALIVSGLSAGKVTLAPDALGRMRATRDLRGVAFWRAERDDAAPQVRELGGLEDLGDADAFLNRIRRAVSLPREQGAK